MLAMQMAALTCSGAEAAKGEGKSPVPAQVKHWYEGRMSGQSRTVYQYRSFDGE